MQNTALQLPLFEDIEKKPGQVPGFSVRQSNRAKRLSIKVFPSGRVEVVVPRRTSSKSVQAFVEENRDWIERAQASFAENFSPDAFVLPSIIELPAIDRRVIVRYQPERDARKVRYRYANGLLTLRGNTGNEDACVGALRRWLSGMARSEFEPLLEALSRLTGISYKRMHIRMQRTCWGSRSCSGTISLNLCLLFLKPELLRYLLIHELCHGRHMNHSRRFWQLVGQYEPSWKRLDRQLGESWRAVPAWLGMY